MKALRLISNFKIKINNGMDWVLDLVAKYFISPNSSILPIFTKFMACQYLKVTTFQNLKHYYDFLWVLELITKISIFIVAFDI